jgi:hypothetical protein
MPLNVREKTKINPRRNRFALVPCDANKECMILIDRDAETVFTVETKGRYVARVAKPYACALLALMNRGDDNGLLTLKPAKRKKAPSFTVP